MGKPFEVELDVGAVAPIRYKITEEWLSEHRDPQIASLVRRADRLHLRTAAYEVVVRSVERNREKPVIVSDDTSVYFVPTYAIRFARLIDLELEGGDASIGFRMGNASTAPPKGD